MKIAILSSFPPRKCGIAHINRSLFDALRAQGHELVTFGIDESDCDYKIDTSSLTGMLKTAAIIKRLGIRHVSMQFIISFYGKKFLGLNVLLFLLALRDRRVIVTVHELHHIRSPGQILRKPLDLFHIALEILIARLSAGVILHSEAQVADIRKYGVRNARRIYLGIDPRPIIRGRAPSNKALFFGKLAPFKGVHLFDGIARACPGIHFVIAGSAGSGEQAYTSDLRARFTGVPNIEFIYRDWFGDDEKEALFAASDVLVLPYIDTYYQSGVAAESGVYNIPVIVPRLGPLSEIVDKFRTGESVAAPEPAEIAAAIGTILENYPAYLEGIRRYREEANWSVAAREYAAFLQG
jgi:glycosyltransferase involved in cell wall biosynthesis